MAMGVLIAAMRMGRTAADEFHDWYDTEHVPERLRVGVRGSVRGVGTKGITMQADDRLYAVHGRFLSSGPTLAVLGTIPLGSRFEIYGRGGLYFADTRFRLKVQFSDGSEGQIEWKAGTQEFFGGLGGAWNINEDYSLRAEVSYFMDVGDDDRTGEASITTLAVGIAFR